MSGLQERPVGAASAAIGFSKIVQRAKESRLKPLIWTSPVCEDWRCWRSDHDCSLISGSSIGMYLSLSPDGMRASIPLLLHGSFSPRLRQVGRRRSSRCAIVARLRNRRSVTPPLVRCEVTQTAAANSRLRMAQARRALRCASATQALLNPRRATKARNQRLCASCLSPSRLTTERAP